MITPTIQDLLPKEEKYTFLVGAGCSINSPSSLPAGKQMMKALIEHSCVSTEVGKILQLENLRFEQLVEILRDTIDPKLKIIDYYGLSNNPNRIHLFLAEMMRNGNHVITTNFDYLIEYALLESGIDNGDIVPVITKMDYSNYSEPDRLVQEQKFPVYKIHGSSKNIITEQNTKDSLIATIQAFGSGKETESVFQLEPFKRPLFENISNKRTLVVMGYSGSDDFDIVPTLKQLKDLNKIIWIDHSHKDPNPQVQSILEIENAQNDKIAQILSSIQQMGYGIPLYRAKVDTNDLVEMVSKTQPPVDQEPSIIDPKTYLMQEIGKPDKFLEYYIPYTIFQDLGKVQDAHRCAQIVLERAREDNNQSWLCLILKNLGVHSYYNGKLDESLEYYKESLEISEKIQDLKKKSGILGDMGAIFEDKGQLTTAMQHYLQSLSISEQLGNFREKALSLNKIGKLFHLTGKLQDALEKYREALSIDDQNGDLKGKAIRLNNIGGILHQQGKINESLRVYQEALAISDQLGDLRGKSNRLNNIGLLFKEQGKIDDALNYHSQALAIDEKLGDLHHQATDLHNIGKILHAQGKFQEALNHFNKALQIDEQLGDPRGKVARILAKGQIFDSMGKLDLALQHYQESLNIATKVDYLLAKATCLANIGTIMRKKKKLTEAIEYYEESLKIDKKMGNLNNIAHRLNGIGHILYSKGDLPTALLKFKEALSINEQLNYPQGKQTCYNNIGSILRVQGDLNNAMDNFNKALSISEKLGDNLGNAEILHNLGAVYYQQGNFDKALTTLENCLQIKKSLGVDPRSIASTQQWIDGVKSRRK